MTGIPIAPRVNALSRTVAPAASRTLETDSPIRIPRARLTSAPQLTASYTQLAQTVRESGLMRRARWFYGLVGLSVLLCLAGCIAGFVLLGDSWFQLFVAAGLAIVFTQIAFLAHEAGHRQILASGPANDRLARVLAGSIGMSFSWWNAKHSKHHANPNRVGKDPDIAVDTVSFIEEDAEQARGLRRWITQRQGWLFFPLLTLEGLNLHYLGLKHLLSTGPVKARWTELGIISARFAVLLIPVFAILPLGMAFAFLGVQLAIFGVYMGASFAPNHKGMPIIAKDAKLDFFSKQVRTSRNVGGGWWATWLMGGLNYQIEHHLFPSMARPFLSKARQIVREQCVAQNVPYTETTLLQSYGIVIRYLNRVGLAARDPFDCPMAGELRRM